MAELEVPTAWERLDLARLAGVTLVLGATDVGKSTFAHYLVRRLAQVGGQPEAVRQVALVDGDVGQNAHGPPATQSLAWVGAGQAAQTRRCFFAGAITPVRHFLDVLTGITRLVGAAQAQDATHVVVDTSGLIDPRVGGLALKLSKIDLLRPAAVVAIQRQDELEPLLRPLKRSGWTQLIVLEPAAAVRSRSREARRARRQAQFKKHFQKAQPLTVHWPEVAVFPAPHLSERRLVSLEGPDGWCRALGVVLRVDRPARKAELLTALPSLEGITTIRLGDLRLDPHTFEHQEI